MFDEFPLPTSIHYRAGGFNDLLARIKAFDEASDYETTLERNKKILVSDVRLLFSSFFWWALDPSSKGIFMSCRVEAYQFFLVKLKKKTANASHFFIHI